MTSFRLLLASVLRLEASEQDWERSGSGPAFRCFGALAFLSVGDLDMSVDLKTLTPDASLPTTGFVFGADSQASVSPSVYTTAAVATAVGLQFPAGAQATPSISTTGDNDTGIWFPAANTVAVSTGGTERMRVDNAGRVGINATSFSANARLQVTSSTQYTGYVLSNGTNDAVRIVGYGAANDEGGISLLSGGVERVRILSTSTSYFNAGNVGIGTSSPTGGKVHIVGTDGSTSLLVAGATRGVRVQTNATGSVIEGVDQTGAASYQPLVIGGSDVRFTTSNIERMRIHSSGDVGIGATTTPNARLDVAGRIWSTPPAGGFAGLTMYSAAASGFVPGLLSFTRASASGGATPNNSAVGEFRFDGRDANGAYASFALISAEMFTNAAGGAPASMTFAVSASGASAQERMRLTSQGLGVGTTSFGTSAERVLSIGTGVAPTTGPADTIQIYSTDLSAGNTILSLYTEGTPVNANTTAAATHRIAVRINGTVYYLLANTSA